MKKLIVLKSVKNNESVKLLKIFNKGFRRVFNVQVQEVPPSKRLSDYDQLYQQDKIHSIGPRGSVIEKLVFRYSSGKCGYFLVKYENRNKESFGYIQKVKF